MVVPNDGHKKVMLQIQCILSKIGGGDGNVPRDGHMTAAMATRQRRVVT